MTTYPVIPKPVFKVIYLVSLNFTRLEQWDNFQWDYADHTNQKNEVHSRKSGSEYERCHPTRC